MADIFDANVKQAMEEVGANVVRPQDIYGLDVDVFAPCAMGGILNEQTLEVLRAPVIAGAANNQLAHDGTAKLLTEKGITYAPDYCVNAGGVIQVADELDPNGFSFDRAKARATGIFDTTLAVLDRAATEHVTSAEAADRQAEQRMRDVGRLRGIHLPG